MTVRSRKTEGKPETPEKKDAAPDEKDGCQEKLVAAEAKAQEYLAVAQRLQADFDNFRKRTQRENEDFRAFATADLLSELLGIVDDLDRAIGHADADNDFTEGVKGIRQNMMKLLESRGLAEISTDGKFDPNCHEALCVEEADTDGEIAEVFQKGYRIGGRVLRYSKVKVTKKTDKTGEGELKCQE